MRRIFGLAVLIVLLVALLIAARVHGVWTDAVALVDGSERWVAGSARIAIKTLGSGGEVEQTVILAQTVTLTDRGLEVATAPVSAPGGWRPGSSTLSGGLGRGVQSSTGEGAPNAALERGMGQAGGRFGTTQTALPADPFAPEVRDTVELITSSRTRIIGGTTTDEYDITWTAPDGSTFDGSIWLDRVTSAPVRLDVAGDIAAREIREFQTTTTYERTGEYAVPSRSVTTRTVRTGLFSSRTIRVTVSLADYFEVDGTHEYVLVGLDGEGE
jgi:hypothetical protein